MDHATLNALTYVHYNCIGKTHTILGTPEDPGVIPRCVKDIFATIQEEQASEGGDQWNFTVSFSYLEIYNEKVRKDSPHTYSKGEEQLFTKSKENAFSMEQEVEYLIAASNCYLFLSLWAESW